MTVAEDDKNTVAKKKRERRSGGPSVVVPTDIVFSILSRVPVRNVVRFRCVSNSWNTLISDPFFRRSHHSRLRLLILDLGTNTFTSLDPADRTLTNVLGLEYLWFFPVSSCRGLICFDSSINLCVLNPATGDYINSPDIEDCYPNVSTLGFSYIASAGEYKVFFEAIPYGDDNDDVRKYFVFSFGGRMGMRCNAVKGNPPYRVASWPTATVNGIAYMLCSPITSTTRDIIRFDMGCEEWSVIPSPHIGDVSDVTLGIRDLSGSLCYTCYHLKHHRFYMWILKDCGIWKEYEIDISMFVRPILLKNCMPLHPLVVTNYGRILFHTYFKDEKSFIQGKQDLRNQLVYYCPRSKKFEEVYRIEKNAVILPYEESFASPFDASISEIPNPKQDTR